MDFGRIITRDAMYEDYDYNTTWWYLLVIVSSISYFHSEYLSVKEISEKG